MHLCTYYKYNTVNTLADTSAEMISVCKIKTPFKFLNSLKVDSEIL